MRRILFYLAFYLVFAIIQPSDAQNDPGAMDPNMPGMSHEDHSTGRSMQPASLIDLIQQHSTSGTDAEPLSTPAEMLMKEAGSWTFMFHGTAFLNEVQQTSPRGADKFFSTNWVMPMAQKNLGRGTLTLRAMLSLEPATISQQRYPELFQQGETAFGRPIIDGQHPHDLFMEVAALYDYRIAEHALLSLYFAPMGDPAMGPNAYPHRASASENPVAPLGHHLQDSTHVADDVLTVGLTYHALRVEASGFHGREPDEYRWNLDSGKMDSWSARFSVNPSVNWSAQYSIAQLHSPEVVAPEEDVRRMTASVSYNRPLHGGNWASMLLWGRNQSLQDGNVGNGYLLESTLKFLDRNAAWARIENVDRTNELLFNGGVVPPGFTERYFTRLQAYTAGYDRELGHIPHVSTALGGELTWHGVPEPLRSTYGLNPVSAVLFLRFRVH